MKTVLEYREIKEKSRFKCSFGDLHPVVKSIQMGLGAYVDSRESILEMYTCCLHPFVVSHFSGWLSTKLNVKMKNILAGTSCFLYLK